MSFSERLIKAFRSIYANCFSTLRFLAEVSTKLQKMLFLDNLRTWTQEESMETRQMTPFFIYFFCSNCLQYSFLYLKMVKIHFLVAPLWSILVCKIPQFWGQATDSDSHHIFLESWQTEVTKIHIMFCPPRRVKKRYQLMD